MQRRLIKYLERIYHLVQPWPVLGPLARLAGRVFMAARKALFYRNAVESGGLAAERIERLEILVDGLSAAARGSSEADLSLRGQLQSLDERLAHNTDALDRLQVAIDHRFHASGAMHEALERRLDAALLGHGRLEQRVEFVREETLFELRRALELKPAVPPGQAATLSPPVTRILNPEKLREIPRRVNLGCGHIPLPDMVNVDARALPGVDVVADVAALPFDPGTLDLIHAAHLLEHFPRRYLLDVVLPHWRSRLTPAGVLQLIVPDTQAMLDAYQRGEMTFETLALVTFGGQDYDGDFHYAMYTPEDLRSLLFKSGFERVDILAQDRPNGLCREMELHAFPSGSKPPSEEASDRRTDA
jgi:hypothetical protein